MFASLCLHLPCELAGVSAFLLIQQAVAIGVESLQCPPLHFLGMTP